MSASQLSLMAFFLCFVMINGQSTQTLSPVSQCLNNCTACLPTTPATCAPLLIGGYVLNCIPFYTSDTANCGSAEAGVTVNICSFRLSSTSSGVLNLQYLTGASLLQQRAQLKLEKRTYQFLAWAHLQTLQK